jgi:hypothetical protein
MWVSLFRKGGHRFYHLAEGGTGLKTHRPVAFDAEDLISTEPVGTLADTSSPPSVNIARCRGVGPEQVRIAIEA